VIGQIVRNTYRRLFAHERYRRMNQFLHELSLHGLGVLNYENDAVSGELYVIRRALHKDGTGDVRRVILDVGANDGEYSRRITQIDSDARVFAFEPHPVTYERLSTSAKRHGFEAINAGCGETEGTSVLYDYSGNSGSQHASLYRTVIEGIHGSRATGHEIRLTTVDSFLKERGIAEVRLLKIDTEGNEASVLRGARESISSNRIELVQFEFNEMHVASRTFFKDFVDLLANYRLYRILPDGCLPLAYRSVSCEIFAYQNILAVRNDIAW
jgi:FkbM family methyltransferase